MNNLMVGTRVEFDAPESRGITGVGMWQGTVVEAERTYLRVRWDHKPEHYGVTQAQTYGRFDRDHESHLRIAEVERTPNTYNPDTF